MEMANTAKQKYMEIQPYVVAEITRSKRLAGGAASGGLQGGSSSGIIDISTTTGTLSWARVDKTGSSIANLANHSHSLLSGLTADDHTQYVHTGNARTITAAHTFNRAGTGAPFVIGANSTGRLVAGLNADQVDGFHESTFMRRDANSALDMNGYNITSDDGDTYVLVGRAYMGYAGVNDSAMFGHRDYRNSTDWAFRQYATNGITAINTPTGGQIRFRQNDISIATLDSDDFIFNSAVALKTSNYASQTTGWALTYAGAADFRYVYADELHAKAFIADLEQALAGGQIISKSVAILSRDFTAPAAGGTATLYVKDLPSASNMAVFVSGDYVRLRQFSRASGSLAITNCWGVVTSYSDLSGGEQSWTFTRSSGADAGAMSAGYVVKADSIVLDYGTTGNGFYEVNAIDGAYAVNSPYMQIVTWDTHPRSGQTVRVRVGNLTGVGFTGEYGLYAAGGASSEQYIKTSDDSFILAGGPSGSTTIDENGVNIEVSTNYADDRAYTFSNSSAIIGQFTAYKSGDDVSLAITTSDVSNHSSFVYLLSDAIGTTELADTFVRSLHTTRPNNPAMFRLYADETDCYIQAYADIFYMDVGNGVCFAGQDEIVTGNINIYMGGTGHLYCRFPNGTIRELAAD